MTDPWFSQIRYRKTRLYERKWHKYVITSISGKRVLDAMRQLSGPMMYRNGGDYVIVMLAEETDRVAFRLLLDFSTDEDRGYGIWGGKKYHCAATNRIS